MDQSPDTYQYVLSVSQIHTLEREIALLIRSGNTWDDLYTQCVLANILLAFREGRSYDPDLCKREGISEDDSQEQMTNAITDLLESYLEDYYDSSADQKEQVEYPDLEYDGEVPVNKKDEFVKVHKYLKSHKRDPFQSEYEEGDDYAGTVMSREYPDLAADNNDGDQEYGSYLDDDDSDDDYNMDEFLANISPEKLRLLQEYLGPLFTKETEPVTGR